MLGKKLYKTSMLNVFKLVILAVVVFFTNDFILDTYTYEKFQAIGRFKILDVLNYHYRYPNEFITFFLIVIVPAIYYAFIRGVRFCEKGFVYNRGLPFMNKEVLYTDVKSYKLLQPNHVITIHTQKGDVFVIADNNIERVIAILDQHNIPGDLARDDYSRLLMNAKKFLIVVLTFTLVVFLLKKFGLLPR
ncbi:hypothetical protein ACJVC5_19570 [Peredibacter sp. HCB2-198]|uniref:hypothetical protein n=1 Tax=Peredibacter sp. HCB2-198 TaxID=3383025 RepID=UPI0038B47033